MAAAAVSACRRAAARDPGAAAALAEAAGPIAALPEAERAALALAAPWAEILPEAFAGGDGECCAAACLLLEALTSARPPLADRRRFYGHFESGRLCEACVELVAAGDARGSAHRVALQLCVRNLARGPPLRARLAGAIPGLAASLGAGADGGADLALAAAAAAALCNVCCDDANKLEAVRCGAVPRLLAALKLSPTHEAAEDFVACVGVLTSGCVPGLETLFASGDAPALLACLYCAEHPPLQALAADVLVGVASSSQRFRAWMVGSTDLVRDHLPELLTPTGQDQLLDSALQLCNLLVGEDGFIAKFQSGGGVSALQATVEAPAEVQGSEGLVVGGRRPATKRQLAQSLLAKILFL